MNRRTMVLFWQIMIVVVTLGGWEILTRIPWMVQNTLIDPFFISRPSLIGARLGEWIQPGPRSLWPALAMTLEATFWGLLVGAGTGYIVGITLSVNKTLADILNPFIVALNSMPRIAFVPLITMFFGIGILSKVMTAWFVVFFLVFFNAYKGGLSVEKDLIDFCRTLGATKTQILWRVRIPTAAAWTFAALPNAISFALIGVVLAEFMGSDSGIGYQMMLSLATMSATDMFASVFVLSIVGLALVYTVQFFERKILHWTAEFRNK